MRDNPVVILHQPKNPLNMGAVVRAMKNMGLGKLRLVQPRFFDRDEILRVAHHCEDVVDNIEFYDELNEALADRHFVVGTAADPHPAHVTTNGLRSLASELTERAHHQQIALLFGPEADGLDLHALDRCHIILHLPTNPDYPPLNLAQAALLVFYELYMASCHTPTRPPPPVPASHDELERMFALVEEALTSVRFFKRGPVSIMRYLRQISYRTTLTSEEVALFMAMARQILWASKNLFSVQDEVERGAEMDKTPLGDSTEGS